MSDLQNIYNLCRTNADATWDTDVSPFTVDNMIRLCMLQSLNGKYQYTHQYPKDLVEAQQALGQGQQPAMPLRILENYYRKISALKAAFDESPFTFVAGQNGFAITWNDIPEEQTETPTELPETTDSSAVTDTDNVEVDAPPALETTD